MLCGRGILYGKPHSWAAWLFLWTGLWWPLVKTVSELSECAVDRRGFLESVLDGEDVVVGTSVSGTGSR